MFKADSIVCKAAWEVAFSINKSSSRHLGNLEEDEATLFNGKVSMLLAKVAYFKSVCCKMSCTDPNASKTDKLRF